ncbi:MAG: transglutaminase family protein [Eubacteriales bacterium]|nr:transglutaminase family protein [Eubacteriales bacterium]
MKLWKLSYELKDRFDGPVTEHSFSLRCLPRESTACEIRERACQVFPPVAVGRGADSFGNGVLTGRIQEPHHSFAVRSTATVLMRDEPLPAAKSYYALGMYRYPTRLTGMGRALLSFYQGISLSFPAGTRQRAAELMDRLYTSFRYVAGSTSFYTGAEEAFEQGCGVCQDYAHILLALLRQDKATCRYVAGAIPGEGQSHAWVEVWEEGSWYGLDPTHNCPAGDGYIPFAVGRDAWGCPLSRGIFRGNVVQTQEVCVKMEEQRLDQDSGGPVHAGFGGSADPEEPAGVRGRKNEKTDQYRDGGAW